MFSLGGKTKNRHPSNKTRDMKKYLLTIFILLGTCIIWNFSTIKLVYRYYINPCYYDKPIKQDDFPQQFLEIDLANYYEQIKGHTLPVFLKLDTLAQIDYKGVTFPVLVITNDVKQAKHRLLIFAGVHGNESGGTLAILKLLEDMHAFPSKYENWSIKIVTPVNPIGTMTMSRYNENGCDLNREVATSTQKGIVLQRKIIASFQPEIVVSLHEAPADGFFIHPGPHLSLQLRHLLLEEVSNKGVQLATSDYLGRDLKTPGTSEVKGILKILKNIAQVQSLGDYLASKNIIEITTESGWNSLDTFKRVDSHFLLIEALVNHFD